MVRKPPSGGAGVLCQRRRADSSISAADGEKHENDLWRRTSQESRQQRKPGLGSEENLNTRKRESSSGKCACLFPPGSLLITLLIFKRRAETHASITSAVTRYQRWRPPTPSAPATPLSPSKQLYGQTHRHP